MRRQEFSSSCCRFALVFALAANPAARAGDLLRGGSTFAAPTQAAASYGTNASVTAQARANASDALARTTQALQAVRSMQAAARNLALTAAAPVPNGLAPGGLQLAPNTAPVGANAPRQSLLPGGQTAVTVTQTAQQALLNWTTFNIGRKTTLDFDQSAGGANSSQWIAFNKVSDPSGVPSQILGSIHAQGQVYVINQNGIIFGGASQVNVHTLVASSLPINDNLIARGLLNNPDLQFLFSALAIPVLPAGTEPAFTPPAPLTASGLNGDVVVKAGATLSAPSTAAHIGGRIALIGPNVTNAGSISTPDGQTILAAGLQVGFAAHPTGDPSLRGLDVSVGAVPYGGVATNTGLILAPRADVVLTGKTVNQLGAINGSTSVSLNGRIDLLADYDTVRLQNLDQVYALYPSAEGNVNLGPGSVTQILPETSSAETVTGSQLALQSQINVRGEAIHLAANSLLLAPSAAVSLDAGAEVPFNGVFTFSNTVGQIYLDAGALLDVAGSVDVSVPVSQNIVSVQLRGSELADSPLQRNGLLRGQTVQVDVRQTGINSQTGDPWVGTSLGKTTGYIGLIERTAGELTTAGGSVNLTAGGSVVMQHGSQVNVSGGWLSYQGGIVQTTRVLAGGELFDIGKATPDMVYQGIFTGQFTATHPKYGVSETFTNPLAPSGFHYEAGYIQGGDGGSIAITAPSVALDGDLLGNVAAGPRQRSAASGVNASLLALLTSLGIAQDAVQPASSALSLTFQANNQAAANALYSPTPPEITFAPEGGLPPVHPFAFDSSGNPLPLNAVRVAKVNLSPALFTTDGFGNLTVNDADGKIVVPATVALTTPAGGSVTLTGANVDIEGKLTAPGGALSFIVPDISPSTTVALESSPSSGTPPSDPTRGNFILGAQAALSTAGLLVNDQLNSSSPGTLPLATAGGNIAVTAYNARLVAGSTIDVSGGVAVAENGKRTYGNAGSIALSAGQDPTIKSVLGGKLELGAALTAYSGAKAGSLSITAPLIQIGGQASNPATLLLAPAFFSEGGFGAFTLDGLGMAAKQIGEYLPALIIAPGAVIAPLVESSLAVSDPTSGGSVTLMPTLEPEGVRAPVSLTFGALGVTDFFNSVLIARGDFVMGSGAVIRTDPETDPTKGVTISGNTAAVLGSIITPGGSIKITGGKSFAQLAPAGVALPTVDLGPKSFLSTAGATVLATPDTRGYRQGSVLPGGSITVSGNIVAEAGSVLNVSGASALLDTPPAATQAVNPAFGSFHGSPVVLTRMDTAAGSINFAGSQELFMDARLIGRAGGPDEAGGSLSLSSGRFYPPDAGSPPTPLDVTTLLTQNGPVIPAAFYPARETAIGNPVLGKDGNPLKGFGYFAVDDFNGHGFDSVNIAGTVEFSGPVRISANSSVTMNGGVLLADPTKANSSLSLSAPYVNVGTPFQPPTPAALQTSVFLLDGAPFYIQPTHGAATLFVSARDVDLGNLTLQNIGAANIVAAGGDIRGNGALDVAGAITLTAGQIYPPTEVPFTIHAFDYVSGGENHLGSVTIASSGVRRLPLSAGGELNVYGSIIKQGGVLRAPIGVINLGYNGQGTAPTDFLSNAPAPVTSQLTLAAGSVTSVSAVDPVTGRGIIIPYGINLNGTAWIDPSGVDITTGGVPEKAINLLAANIDFQAGASVDIRGGGDLYAYRFVNGTGGTQDILASSFVPNAASSSLKSFAVIPGYQADYAPFAAYNTVEAPNGDAVNAFNTAGTVLDTGYSINPAGTALAVGRSVYLGASSGLPAGTYTVLPARYALLPGAFLVTPRTGGATGTVSRPDGSSLVSGYSFNDLNGSQTAPLLTSFEVDPQSVVRSRAEYDNSFANTFLKQSALANNVAVPRLPVDSGHLVFDASLRMNLLGAVAANAPPNGLGGLIDISTPEDILIAGPGVAAPPGVVLLTAAELSSFNAQSLLIGGLRATGADSTAVTVQTGNITVDNAGSPLSVQDLILVANDTLTLNPNADIRQSGAASTPAEKLVLGDAATPGSGDGVLLRLSNDPQAQIARSGVDGSTIPSLVVKSGVHLSGASVILDSTHATSLAADTVLKAQSVSLDSGQISIQLSNPGALNPTSGLALSGLALQTLQSSAQSLSLLSYSSIDIYGSGAVGSAADASLALHAAEFRGFNDAGGSVSFAARNILLDNAPLGAVPGPAAAPAGTLSFNASTIRLGANEVSIDQYAQVDLNASGGVLAQSSGGLSSEGALTLIAPVVTGATGAQESFESAGALLLLKSAVSAANVAGGRGANLTFQGASITANSEILAPSGDLTLHATTGDVTIGGQLAAAGTEKVFPDLIEYSGGGRVTLTSDAGNVTLGPGSAITVAGAPGGGDAGALSVSSPHGDFASAGTLRGKGGAGGQGGSFSLDVGSLPSTGALNATLDAASFSQSRSFRVRTGDVVIDGLATTKNFDLSSDAGSIQVAGEINASGARGGKISLEAYGSVTLLPGSTLNAAGNAFDDASEGGAISLAAGSETNGAYNTAAVVDIQAGSTVDLSIAGGIGGTLHLRAPATPAGLQANPVNGSIDNASSIVIEGYQIFDATADGSIDNQESNVMAGGAAFGANSAAITSALLANNGALAGVTHVQFGAEIINTAGDLTLNSDWDLSTYRFGPNGEPGVLTLRAAGNLVFNGALSDGFTSSNYAATLLPPGSPAWSYNMAAGADFSAADIHQVQPAALLGGGGSLLLGVNDGINAANPPGPDATTNNVVQGFYQVIRTGAGAIYISTGGNIELLNEFATIYTAGSQASALANFDLPRLFSDSRQLHPLYPAQYSSGGGDVTLQAQGDIEHLTTIVDGFPVEDSSRELPINWLYRRGYVNSSGVFGNTPFRISNEVASTSWWVDFSNFFEGVGALGGGNVTLLAGHNIANVDAVIPTNARAPKGTPDASALVELGGGDLIVRAGNDINGGVYYVERGRGTLSAGNEILTNSTRSPSLTTIIDQLPYSPEPPDSSLSADSAYYPPQTWLPTTLFLGKGSFDVTAQRNVLLGPVENPFLQPVAAGNSAFEKSYFSTYSSGASVDVSSLAGSVTLREGVTLPTNGTGAETPTLLAFIEGELLETNDTGASTAAFYQPFLRLAETNVTSFTTVSTLMPPVLRVAAYSGDVNIVGNFSLFPAPTGTLELAAGGSINGTLPNGVTVINGNVSTNFSSSTINLSDADPTAIPGITSPLAYQAVVGSKTSLQSTTLQGFLSSIDDLFAESGSVEGAFGVLQTKEELHDGGILHKDDLNPVKIDAASGSVSGLTLFSSKSARVHAGTDITDLSLYIQNDSPGDITVVTAGRDIIPYDTAATLFAASQAAGNTLDTGQSALAGDIQISGPGALEVLAGRDLNLGVGPNNPDGTGVGIASIGNGRNPSLPFAGADVVAAAGIGPSTGLNGSKLGFSKFIAAFLNPQSAGLEADRYLPDLGDLLGLTGASNAQVWKAFNKVSSEKRDELALDIYYLVLRDSGRDHGLASSPNFGNYDTAYSAISALFPGSAYTGDISLTSREIKTESGGNIDLLAPGGKLTVGFNVAGSQPVDQGILTEDGGNISIYTRGSVIVGTSRIFTLRGGNEIIFSTVGDIAAGASSKTVQSAPPTRVLIDPQSGNVQTDLAGLATGGGIGVLETVTGVPPANVDLIAPTGTVDAGDAGIRVSGNLNISALHVLNASNIQVNGASAGVPAPAVVAPNLAGLTSAANAAGAGESTASEAAKQSGAQQAGQQDLPSIITVEVVGYGGGDVPSSNDNP